MSRTGASRASGSAALPPLQSIDPSTGDLLVERQQMSDEEVTSIIGQAAAAQQQWSRSPFDERAAFMRDAAALLKKEIDPLARLMAREMGKVISDGRSEIEKCAWVCEHYAEHAQAYLRDEPVPTDARRSFVTCRPLGVVLAVMPWNFPFWQVFRFAAPGLMAGNGGVLKHAANVSGCALAIEDLLRRAGLPVGLFRTLLIGSDRVERVIEHPSIAAVTLTGSTAAGRAVASAAGRALKKSVLELGGSDAYVVLEDADVEHAVRTCVKSRLINAGQSCIAAKRFIVVEALREPFERRFVELMAAARMGDPLDESSELGPQARDDLRDDLHRQVRESIDRGARCLLGGEVPERAGAWYPPTVLAGVRPGMPAWDEELFGPVAAIRGVADEDQAIAAANDSSFGLGAAVFTSDLERGERIAADRLEAGACFVNGLVRSDPRLPFGGIKESGYGRELGREGIREFVNIKSVYVAKNDQPRRA